MSMTLSAIGVALIHRFETLALKAYLDEGGVWTIGWGHTGPAVNALSVCTPEMADEWFMRDTQIAIKAVNETVTVPLTQNEFDALCSFTYNVGAGSEAHSSMLVLLNVGRTDLAADEFLRWDHVDGIVSAGLMERRKAEQELFLS